MAIAITVLTAPAISTASVSDTTASVTLVANRLYLVLIYQGTTGSPEPTVSGAGQTWALIRSDLRTSNYTRRLSSFRCKPSADNSGALTLDYSGVSCVAGWAVLEVTGMDTSGTNGAGAIGDSDTGGADTGATSGTVPDLTLTNSDSVNLSFWCHKINEATTHEDGWTELFDNSLASVHSFEGQWKVNDVSATASWTSSVAWMGQGLEIKAASAGQILYPDADVDASTWTTTPLWSKIDEVTAGGDVISDTTS